MMPPATPIQKNERALLLDVLRGIAILGILFNNIYGFSGYGFLPEVNRQAFPTYQADDILDDIQVGLVEGKFYSLFSLLFGIGFSILLVKNQERPLKIFYRRLAILFCIGAIHLLFFWEGDILLLYALIGCILPLFRNCSDRTLITWAVVLILSPVLIDLVKLWTNTEPAAFLFQLGRKIDEVNGIPTDQGFAFYLYKEGSGWNEWRNWTDSGVFYRYGYILQSNRIPKVLGMFLLGLYAGRHSIYAHPANHRPLLKRLMIFGYSIGIPSSLALLYFSGDEKRIPADAWGMADTIAYALSVVPLSLAYTATITWFWMRSGRSLLRVFAPAGRMALTNYLFQTAMGILIFYGAGLGLGQKFGLTYLFLVATGIYFLQLLLSHLWFRSFNYGPIEWIWRQLTYGKRLPIRKKSSLQTTGPVPAPAETIA